MDRRSTTRRLVLTGALTGALALLAPLLVAATGPAAAATSPSAPAADAAVGTLSKDRAVRLSWTLVGTGDGAAGNIHAGALSLFVPAGADGPVRVISEVFDYQCRDRYVPEGIGYAALQDLDGHCELVDDRVADDLDGVEGLGLTVSGRLRTAHAVGTIPFSGTGGRPAPMAVDLTWSPAGDLVRSQEACEVRPRVICVDTRREASIDGTLDGRAVGSGPNITQARILRLHRFRPGGPASAVASVGAADAGPATGARPLGRELRQELGRSRWVRTFWTTVGLVPGTEGNIHVGALLLGVDVGAGTAPRVISEIYDYTCPEGYVPEGIGYETLTALDARCRFVNGRYVDEVEGVDSVELTVAPRLGTAHAVGTIEYSDETADVTQVPLDLTWQATGDRVSSFQYVGGPPREPQFCATSRREARVSGSLDRQTVGAGANLTLGRIARTRCFDRT